MIARRVFWLLGLPLVTQFSYNPIEKIHFLLFGLLETWVKWVTRVTINPLSDGWVIRVMTAAALFVILCVLVGGVQ